MENRHFLILIWCILFSGCVVVKTVSFNCTFEGFCNCERVKDRYNLLTWGRQKSPTTATGPDSDHTSGDGFYIYINSSNELANKRARLFIPWKPPGNYCLSFWYYMNGRHTDILRIAVRENQTKLATKSRITNIIRKEWILQKIKLTSSKNFRIVIDGIIKTDEHDFGYIAVDDVKLFRDECPTHCSDLTPVLDKAVVRDILKGSIVYINTTCKEGFERKENSFIVCQNSGKWSDTPSCQPIDCGKPPLGKEMLDVTPGKTTFNTTIRLSCSRELTLIGNSSITCMANGKWSTLPRCVINKCSEPILTKGLLEPSDTSWYKKHVIILACGDGTTLRGNSTITCQDNGNWTTLPTCDYTEESGQSAITAIAVTVPLLAIGILVITIVVVCRKRKWLYMRRDRAHIHETKPQTQNPNKIYCDLNKSLGQETEYAVISNANPPVMEEIEILSRE